MISCAIDKKGLPHILRSSWHVDNTYHLSGKGDGSSQTQEETSTVTAQKWITRDSLTNPAKNHTAGYYSYKQAIP